MRLSASQLGTWERCPTQYRFEKVEGREGSALSATVYGTVVHHGVHTFERKVHELVAEGMDVYAAMEQAKAIALDTFDYYWHPSHLMEVAGVPQIDEWLGYGAFRDTYGYLRQKGFDAIEKYAELWRADQHQLLSLEHPFEVPVVGTVDDITGEPHTISGYVDRLVIRWKSRKPILDTDDWKTGRKKTHLRYHLGLTVYSYASTQVEFWKPFEDQGVSAEEMHARFADIPRHTVWYDLKSFERCDGGYRAERDYARLARAVTEVARSVQHGIFPLRISGETCFYCPHKAYCPEPDIGLPDDTEGAP